MLCRCLQRYIQGGNGAIALPGSLNYPSQNGGQFHVNEYDVARKEYISWAIWLSHLPFGLLQNIPLYLHLGVLSLLLIYPFRTLCSAFYDELLPALKTGKNMHWLKRLSEVAFRAFKNGTELICKASFHSRFKRVLAAILKSPGNNERHY